MSERAVDYLTDSGPVVPSLVARERSEEYVSEFDCYYCGEPAGTVDHVVPTSMLQVLSTLDDDDVTAVLVRFGRRLTVPACGDCNGMLSNSYQDTLAKRKAELKERMRRRYRKLLRVPDWSDSELGQLEGRLRDAVIVSVVRRDIILRRLRY